MKVGLHFAVIICTNSEKTNNHNFRLSSEAALMKVTSLLCIREKALVAVVNLLTDPEGRTVTKQAKETWRFTFVVDLSVSIDVSFSDHLLYFPICQFLSQVCHDVAELCGADVTVAILRTRRGGYQQGLSAAGRQGSDLPLPCVPANSLAPLHHCTHADSSPETAGAS